MVFEKVRIDRQADVSVVWLNEPSTLNALTAQMVEELDRALEVAAGDSRAIVLTGSGRAFCSGANLNTVLDPAAGEERDFGQILETHANPLMNKLRRLPIPWISAVRNAAVGVGCSLALAADLVIASDNAYFQLAFARIGLIPDGGCSHLLARGLSRVRSMEMMMLGEKIPARQALEWGLINRVVSDGALDSAALELAQGLTNGPTLAYGLMRQLVWNALDADWETALRLERELQTTAGRTQDAVEGITAFIERRPPKFKGK